MPIQDFWKSLKEGNTSNQLIPEEKLIRGLILQERAMLSYLYDHYGKALYGVVSRIVKDDEIAREVIQDVFLKVWNKISTYDSARGRFFTWLLNIARNEAINKIRSKEIKQSGKTEALDSYVYTSKDNSTIDKVEGIGVRELVNELGEEQQFVLNKVYFEGYTQTEIAEEYKIPLGTVKSRVRAALKKLRRKENI